MKKSMPLLFLPIVFFAVLCASCSKNKTANALEGTWELRSTMGFDIPSVAYAPGNGNKLVFDQDGVLTRWEKNNLVSTTTYTIGAAKDCHSDNAVRFFEVKDSRFPAGNTFVLQSDALVINMPPCIMDGSSSTYVRVN